ncbi:TPA: hypothetical protein HA249_06690 [Candidatus Woesearchaeota archaeon]|nr:MAG: endonuclease III related protein [archaeon GW2011_AR16]HIG96542.1 hypothetical protein [Candidatus Woesearchaeota archaeon]HIH47633.1 hypothetical protein [Candidatus Woesearchaeota archaeon]HII88951.1 hypothetical protein [Candidatus Woesearchaeota archaeon]
MAPFDPIHSLYTALLSTYGPQGWWPIRGVYTKQNNHYRTLSEEERFEICLGAILTQNTAWKNVEKSLVALQKHDLLDPQKLERMDMQKLALLIRSSGYHNQKAKKIRAFLDFLKQNKPVTREHLLAVWGIGPETADSMLLYAYQQPVFVVDAYTKRILSRMGLVEKDADYELVRSLLESAFASKTEQEKVKIFNEFHALFVEHAKQYCRTKPLCEHCPLNALCPKRL